MAKANGDGRHGAGTVLFWLLILLGWIPSGCGGSEEIPAVRNVVLISLDTLRADHLGLYGYPRNTSPNLDALAQHSVVFERAVAPAPNTAPSQMSMMTSLYPGRHGFTGNHDRLAEGTPTLASRLQATGMRTAGFVDSGYLRKEFGFDRGFDAYNDTGGGIAKILPRALRWLDRHGDEPFFLFVHCYDIHAPYQPPPPFRDAFRKRRVPTGFRPTVANLKKAAKKRTELNEVQLDHVISRYDEGILYTDDQIGQLLEGLQERGLDDSTAIIVTSDHGEEFFEHNSYLHWQVYFQPNLRVPLIVRLPGNAGGGNRVKTTAQLVDILPTILELVGAPPLPGVDGLSLGSLLTNGDENVDPRFQRPALAWPPDPSKMAVRSIIAENHQLRFRMGADRRLELFDLEADPMAQQDLHAEDPERAERLRAQGAALISAQQAKTAEPLAIEPKLEAELKALGYLD